MTKIDDIRDTFFQECDDLLEALNDGLGQLGDSADDAAFDDQTVNAVFRAVHSIKGGAAAFALDSLVKFSHHFESVLDLMRSGKVQPSIDLLKICQKAADHLTDLVASARSGNDQTGLYDQDLAAKLLAFGNPDSGEAAAPEQDFGFVPMIIPISLDFDTPTDTSTFIIKFTATYQLFANGNDPVHLFRELADLGEYSVTTDTSELPDFDDLKWDDIHIKWEIRLTTARHLSDISDVFEFVDGLCALSILRLEDELATETPPQLPDIVQQTTALIAPAAQTPTDEDQKLQRGTTEKISASPKASVRVDLDLVDKLINIVGELVINQAVLTQCIDDAGLPESSQTRASLNEFKTLARDIQENMMAIRAQSVKPLFQRMARIAREASDIAGKSVRFETLGETTEVDRTVIERLVDPLTHIIRNSVDHGVEDPARRRDAGKTETGCITLSAAHRSGRVLIEVSDDGAGINRPKVLEIAVSKGLISADAVLSDSEIDQLLFLPGFSTAKVVTNLSGRGVGMDVVRSAIQKLGGRVNISSQPGKGTTIAFSLPLTLAVLDGMVVNVAGQTMVVPITAIIETLRPKAEDIHLIGAEGYVVSIRNKLIPIIDLGQVFGHRNQVGRLSDMVLLLVESDRKQPWALAVDGIYDQRQVVIKSLENNYGHVPGVAAATILGDGKIALIIDPEEATERYRPQGQMRQLQGLEEV